MWLVGLTDKSKSRSRIVLSSLLRNEWQIPSKLVTEICPRRMWVALVAIRPKWRKQRQRTRVSPQGLNLRCRITNSLSSTFSIKTRRTLSSSTDNLFNSFWKMRLWQNYSWLYAVFALSWLAQLSLPTKSVTWQLPSDNSVFKESKAMWSRS